MKKIAFLCLLTALFCSCSVLSTTSDTAIRDSKGHPLGGYKYFHVYSDAQIRTTTSTSSSENGMTSTSHSVYKDDPAEYAAGFMMKKGYVFVPAGQDGFPEGTLLVICAKSGGGFWTTEATVQFMDAQTHELLMTVSEVTSGNAAKSVFRCMQKAFNPKSLNPRK